MAVEQIIIRELVLGAPIHMSLAGSTPVLTFDDPRHGRRHYAVTHDTLRMLRDWIDHIMETLDP
jgi:hypothetical protein